MSLASAISRILSAISVGALGQHDRRAALLLHIAQGDGVVGRVGDDQRGARTPPPSCGCGRGRGPARAGAPSGSGRPRPACALSLISCFVMRSERRQDCRVQTRSDRDDDDRRDAGRREQADAAMLRIISEWCLDPAASLSTTVSLSDLRINQTVTADGDELGQPTCRNP